MNWPTRFGVAFACFVFQHSRRNCPGRCQTVEFSCTTNGNCVQPESKSRWVIIHENVAIHPNGKLAVVLHSGYSQHELVVVDLQTETGRSARARERIVLRRDDLSRRKAALLQWAGDEVVHRFDFVRRQLTNGTTIKLHDKVLRGIPSGLVVDKARKHLFVANVWGDASLRLICRPEKLSTSFWESGRCPKL